MVPIAASANSAAQPRGSLTGSRKLLLERETLEGTELAAALADRGDPPAPNPTSNRPGPPPRAGVLPDWVTVAAGVHGCRGGNRVRDGRGDDDQARSQLVGGRARDETLPDRRRASSSRSGQPIELPSVSHTPDPDSAAPMTAAGCP